MGELTEKAKAVADAIEACGASVELTNAVSLANSLREDIEFMERRAIAVTKKWNVPPEDSKWLPKHAWIWYWISCEWYEKDPSRGRPIPPHRSA